MSEQWRQVEGSEFVVSDHGNVIGLKPDSLIVPYKNKKGYLKLNIWQHGRRKGVFVHRLVAQAFIPNPDDLPQVNHIDGDKTNNNISNLEWCDDSYNLAHAHRLGLRTSAGGHNGNSKLRESDVLQIRRLYGKQGYSSKRLAYIFSVHQTTIQRAISGKRFWKHV